MRPYIREKPMPNGGPSDPIYDAMHAMSVAERFRVEVGDIGDAVSTAIKGADALVVGLFAGVTRFSGAVQVLDEACEHRLGAATREAPEVSGTLGSTVSLRLARRSWAVALGLGPQNTFTAGALETAFHGLSGWLDDHPEVHRLVTVALGTTNTRLTLREFVQAFASSFTTIRNHRVCSLHGSLEDAVLLERDPKRAQRLESLIPDAVFAIMCKEEEKEHEKYLVFHSPHDPYRRKRRVPRWFDTDPEKYRRMFMASLQGLLVGAALEERLRTAPPDTNANQLTREFLSAPEPVGNDFVSFVTLSTERVLGLSERPPRLPFARDDYCLHAGLEAFLIGLLSMHEDDDQFLAERVLRTLADDDPRDVALAFAATTWHIFRYFQDLDAGHHFAKIASLTLDAAPETSSAFRGLIQLTHPPFSRTQLQDALAQEQPQSPHITIVAHAISAPDLPTLLREALPAIGDVAYALPLAAALGGARLSVAGIPDPLAGLVDPEGAAAELANLLLSHWQATSNTLRPT
jgi:hypothetical protein